ncbi:hypothetical protein LTR16_001509 [Cryomyces antarcticus]|uniref:Cytochrome P450 n=1 Tax=Cryomyces antarcticus TaxID=329879 RepID=A0ABR0M8F9_9PEZI|nr:hypothetical protein LTR39_001345 [Cryomyces antarcticus]KAK5020116.1 hypothetical protein LTR60_000822 [Cryomyces antarcticus]KAK5293588.1 hypothetical protein LTR16_001509 [Cryomyces antarcticus]
MHKDPIHVGSVDPLPGVTILTMADDDNHTRRQRRALAHSFSQKALLEQEYIIKGYVDMLIENLNRMSNNDQTFNLVDWLNFTTFDIIGDLAFGEPFGCLEQGEFHFWVKLVYETVKNLLLNFIPKEVRQRRRNHLNFSREKVLRRLENTNTHHKDFIWYILKQREKHDLKQDEIVVNSALFIVAGSETTANLLSGLIARLFYNKPKYDKLVHEIRSSFKTEDELTYENLSKLSYLNACLEEGLRIHPPVPKGC